jgi:hypothetical protein
VQTIALGLLVMPLRHLPGGWHDLGLVVWWIAVAFMAAAVAITVSTGVQYVRDTARAQRAPRPNDAESAGI